MTPIRSICVFCGSSDAAAPEFYRLASSTGETLARNGVRMVYGGGGVGLMGAAARACRDAGGEVVGYMPRFLEAREGVGDAPEPILVDTMHERKQRMYEDADAFIILPGGIGTLDEAIEVLSWARLDLHAKPTAFVAECDFWDPLFELLQHIVEARFMPPDFFQRLVVRASDPEWAIHLLNEKCADAEAEPSEDGANTVSKTI